MRALYLEYKPKFGSSGVGRPHWKAVPASSKRRQEEAPTWFHSAFVFWNYQWEEAPECSAACADQAFWTKVSSLFSGYSAFTMDVYKVHLCRWLYLLRTWAFYSRERLLTYSINYQQLWLCGISKDLEVEKLQGICYCVHAQGLLLPFYPK